MVDEESQFEKVCKGEFNKLHAKLDEFWNKFYIDNGTESIQSKLNRHDIWIGRATKLAIGIGVVIIGLTVDTIHDFISSLIT